MAEGTYEYECMRAELLGIEKPNREEFEEKMRLQREAEQEEQLTEQMKVKKNWNYSYIVWFL